MEFTFNMDRARHLLEHLPIKHRDSNLSVPFHLNPNQLKAFRMMKVQQDKEGWIRAIILKARRVGMSSMVDGLLFCHALGRPQAHAQIVAHLAKTSETGLFRVPRDLGSALNGRVQCCDVRARSIIFEHEKGDSLLDIATAGSLAGGRGLTLSALHLSEAAQYPGDDSFLSLLPAVSKSPGTIIAVESTAFGRVGIGKAFFDFWNGAVEKKNGYIPIFLSWLDDPACTLDPDFAKDAPETDLERELMRKPYHATKGQIAWMRKVLESECKGEEPKFLQEYPHSALVAFVATGDPAFPKKEMDYVRSTVKPPIARGRMRRTGEKGTFEPTPNGNLKLWEMPRPKCWYYIGGDAAAGYESGDFAALVCFNGTTGKQAFKYSNHIHPEDLANLADMMGRMYNDAMVNIELTGNLGRWAQKIMRDKFMYPNLYIWKGKDDRKPGRDKHGAHGWETNAYSRGLLLDSFRESLRAGLKGAPGGIEIYDEELVHQMDLASFTDNGRWDLERGHDDVFIAAMLSIVARAQYPPPNIMSSTANILETPEDKRSAVEAALHPQPSLIDALKRDLQQILRPPPSNRRTLYGV